MEINPQVFNGKVMHQRLGTGSHAFAYSVYYLLLPLPAAPLPGKVHRFRNQDHGDGNSERLELWAHNILATYGLAEKIKHIKLMTMPRIFSYAFNPVSFYFCLDENIGLRAVICEVNNTFGERHHYVCARADHKTISEQEWLSAEKVFHVSPFFERRGEYKFKFCLKPDFIDISIDYLDQNNQKKLITTLKGRLTPLTKQNLSKAFLSSPLLTFKVIYLIHWQALRLLIKKIPLFKKPPPMTTNISTTKNLTKP